MLKIAALKAGVSQALFQFFQVVWLSGWPVFYLLASNTATAQNNSTSLWFTYNHQARISNHWGYTFDLNHRTQSLEDLHSMVSAARVGAVWMPAERTRLSAGYAWFGQHVQGTDQNLQHENRFWQQVQLLRAQASSNHFHRFRLEQRFREITPPGSSRKTAEAFTVRFRYMLQWQGMLLKPARPKGIALKWQAANEIMVHAGDYVKQHYFEQNRLIGGMVLAPSSSLELAVLYQYTLQYLPLAERLQTWHVVRFTLQHNLDFRRPAS